MKGTLLGLAAALHAGLRAGQEQGMGPPILSTDGTQQFLLIASPSRAAVDYMSLPSGKVRPLLDTGLVNPTALTVNGTTLYVVDSGTSNIEAYELDVVSGDHLRAHKYRTALDGNSGGKKPYAAAVGGSKLYFVDKETNNVEVASGPEPKVVKILFDGSEKAYVSSPTAVAVAGLNDLYWANGVLGSSKGSILHADLVMKTATAVAGNVDEVYALCASRVNVFYSAKTADGSAVYGVKRTGGVPEEVTTALANPRGCAFDGDGTIYLADESGAVWSFPANGDILTSMDLEKVTDVEKPGAVAFLLYDARIHAAAENPLSIIGLLRTSDYAALLVFAIVTVIGGFFVFQVKGLLGGKD